MIDYDVARARQAVQFLVDASHFKDYVATLKKNVEKPRAFPYKGDKEVLNELLKIGRQDRGAMERLIEIAQFKRENNDRKAEYQRVFMAAKYKRDSKAIKLEEMLQGKRLNLEERRHLLLKQYEVWNKEKEQFLSMQGTMTWKQKNDAIKDFWALKDHELEQLLEEAGKAQVKHALNKKKRYVVVKQPKETAMKVALKKALEKRK